MATVEGSVKLFLFFCAWTCSWVLFPLAAWQWYAAGQAWPTLTLAVYYVFRAAVPRRRWPSAHRRFSLEHTPYFKTQRVVFDGEGAEDEMKPGASKLFAFHPHGILCVGWTVAWCMEVMRKADVTWLTADILFRLPVISDMLTWFACEGASKGTITRRMREGANLAILPGGFDEAALFKRGEHRVFIKERKGFVKYALQHGYTLHPVYCFGDELSFYTFNGLERLRMWVASFKIPCVIFWGYAGFMPDPSLEITVVVGKGIELPKIPQPTVEEVDRWHGVYIKALEATFYKHAPKYCDLRSCDIVGQTNSPQFGSATLKIR
mmetsp:Transcript_67128/g.212465  ORF Transcript_67128/g.212465 Transcript_67128/m.212465 type:complete len:321 (+) Transcript_67128:1630-2592(+)|eukprot:CAMPEP_0182862278 /NCGR_PEP_ID=MMETSP0034_2-20130328/5974_1 /TAXON_ID=156128 /ORGANISM="Nephroselmis pyriformis, Strain CCMP717" /LENGTH=320 /DNA_ID=CAMNT_0024994319 /DNA_START=1304 /DNA_END=2266 /DNA_ORIENTATION=+